MTLDLFYTQLYYVDCTLPPLPLSQQPANSWAREYPMPPSSSSSGFVKHFEFVEGLDSHKGAGRKKTRSFVTKQHYRKKQFEKGKDEEPSKKGFTSYGVSKVLQPVAGDRTSVASAETSVRIKTHVCNPADGAEPVFRIPFGTTLPETLGSGRADPFNSYPIPATKDVHELVDHCELLSVFSKQ